MHFNQKHKNKNVLLLKMIMIYYFPPIAYNLLIGIIILLNYQGKYLIKTVLIKSSLQ